MLILRLWSLYLFSLQRDDGLPAPTNFQRLINTALINSGGLREKKDCWLLLICRCFPCKTTSKQGSPPWTWPETKAHWPVWEVASSIRQGTFYLLGPHSSLRTDSGGVPPKQKSSPWAPAVIRAPTWGAPPCAGLNGTELSLCANPTDGPHRAYQVPTGSRAHGECDSREPSFTSGTEEWKCAFIFLKAITKCTLNFWKTSQRSHSVRH